MCFENTKFYFICFLLNRYPNRRKSSRITGCGWIQSWDKISVFLPLWGITKGILKESVESRVRTKNITRTQTHKISTNVDDNTSSPSHGVPNCKIRSLFRSTWKKKIKSKNGAFLAPVLHILAVFPLYSNLANCEFSNLIFFFHVGRNNDLILQFGTPWVGEEVLSNRFADILFVCVLVIFLVLTRLSTNSFSILLVIPPRHEKHTDFAPTLKPTTARYTRTFSTIWVSIDFYFFRRIQKK